MRTANYQRCRESFAAPYLTAREKEIVSFIIRGYSSPEIGSLLDLSHKTVETHRSNILRKLDVHSIAELVVWSLHTKLVHLPELVQAFELEPQTVLNAS